MLLHMTLFHSILWVSDIPLYVCTPSSLSLSPVDGHLSCFYVLATVKSAAKDREVHASFLNLVLSRYMLRSRASQVALVVKKLPAHAGDSCMGHSFDPWVRKIPWRRKWQPTPIFLPGESYGQRARWATVHGVAKSRAQLK